MMQKCSYLDSYGFKDLKQLHSNQWVYLSESYDSPAIYSQLE